MTAVFACLLKKGINGSYFIISLFSFLDDNKYRLVKEMGFSLLKLLKTDYWAMHLEIKCFVARFLVIAAVSGIHINQSILDAGYA